MPDRSHDFHALANQTFGELKSALSSLVAALQIPAPRAHEIEKYLGLDRALAWKISQVVDTPGPLVSSRHLPGSSAFDIVINAARKRSVPDTVLKRVERAVAKLDALVREHSGDRSSLEIMLDSLSPGADALVEAKHRKAAFLGNSYILGVQARTKLTALFLHPGSGDCLDAVAVYGFVDLRRLRPDVPWVLSRSAVTDSDGVARRRIDRQPFQERATGADGKRPPAPLLHEFCTNAAVEVRVVPNEAGYADLEVAGGPVGKPGAATLIAAEILPDSHAARADEHNRIHAIVANMTTPCEMLVLDQIVHEDAFGPLRPEVAMYSSLLATARHPHVPEASTRLPMSERVEYLGKGAAVLATRSVPDYPRLGQYVFDRMNWDGDRFDVYRVTMRFPPIPTTVRMQHLLR